MPDCTTNQAMTKDPNRFPTSDQKNKLPTCRQVTCPASPPMTPTMLLPVKSSEPAKITRVSAIPNETPMTNFSAAEPSEANGPPMQKISVMPKPR